MNYLNLTPTDTWQCVSTWQDLRDPTSETPCGISELWLPPLGVSSCRDLDAIIPQSGMCVFIYCHESCEVTDYHGKYLTTQNQAQCDAWLNLTGFRVSDTPHTYMTYYTP